MKKMAVFSGYVFLSSVSCYLLSTISGRDRKSGRTFTIISNELHITADSESLLMHVYSFYMFWGFCFTCSVRCNKEIINRIRKCYVLKPGWTCLIVLAKRFRGSFQVRTLETVFMKKFGFASAFSRETRFCCCKAEKETVALSLKYCLNSSS